MMLGAGIPWLRSMTPSLWGTATPSAILQPTRYPMCGWPPACKRNLLSDAVRVACSHVSGLFVRSWHDRWPRWVPRVGPHHL